MFRGKRVHAIRLQPAFEFLCTDMMIRWLLVLAVGFACAGEAFAQSEAEIQAQIKFEKAMLALQAEKYEIALAAFEDVEDILGPFAELQYNIAQAAYGAGQYEKAKQYVDKVLRTNDARFKAGPEYKEAFRLAAQIELAYEERVKMKAAERERKMQEEERRRRQEEANAKRRQEAECRNLAERVRYDTRDRTSCYRRCSDRTIRCRKRANKENRGFFAEDDRKAAQDSCTREMERCKALCEGKFSSLDKMRENLKLCDNLR